VAVLEEEEEEGGAEVAEATLGVGVAESCDVALSRSLWPSTADLVDVPPPPLFERERERERDVTTTSPVERRRSVTPDGTWVPRAAETAGESTRQHSAAHSLTPLSPTLSDRAIPAA
jgi:hypothetical protein